MSQVPTTGQQQRLEIRQRYLAATTDRRLEEVHVSQSNYFCPKSPEILTITVGPEWNPGVVTARNTSNTIGTLPVE